MNSTTNSMISMTSTEIFNIKDIQKIIIDYKEDNNKYSIMNMMLNEDFFNSVEYEDEKNYINLDGRDGNSYSIMGYVKQIIEDHKLDYDSVMITNEMKEGDYKNLVEVFCKYFQHYIELWKEDDWFFDKIEPCFFDESEYLDDEESDDKEWLMCSCGSGYLNYDDRDCCEDCSFENDDEMLDDEIDDKSEEKDDMDWLINLWESEEKDDYKINNDDINWINNLWENEEIEEIDEFDYINEIIEKELNSEEIYNIKDIQNIILDYKNDIDELHLCSRCGESEFKNIYNHKNMKNMCIDCYFMYFRNMKLKELKKCMKTDMKYFDMTGYSNKRKRCIQEEFISCIMCNMEFGVDIIYRDENDMVDELGIIYLEEDYELFFGKNKDVDIFMEKIHKRNERKMRTNT